MKVRTLVAGLAAGFLLNVLGWLGNQLVLGELWSKTVATVAPLRERTWVNEVLSLVPDFIYGVALAWLFASLTAQAGRRPSTAAKAAFWVWAVGAMPTYLGVWNSGFVPTGLAVATTLLALITFAPAAWLVWKLAPGGTSAVPNAA
ncbi:MAG: hypothetical protein ACRDGM_20095 [bacterium]